MNDRTLYRWVSRTTSVGATANDDWHRDKAIANGVLVPVKSAGTLTVLQDRTLIIDKASDIDPGIYRIVEAER